MTKAIVEPTPEHARCWAGAITTLLARNGWTDADLARKLHAADARARRLTGNRQSLERSVYNWRRGAQVASRRAVITLLAAVGTPEELQAGTIAAGSNLRLLDETLERMGVPVLTRRELLNAAAATVIGAATYQDWTPTPRGHDGPERLRWVLEHPHATDAATVASLRGEVLAGLRGVFTCSPARLLGTADRALEHTAALLPAARGPVRAGLWEVRALALALKGRALSGMSPDWRPAAGAHRDALAAAGQAGTGWVEAVPLILLADLVLHLERDAAGASALTARAVAAATGGPSPATHAWALLMHGEASAACQRQEDAQRSLDAASLAIAARQPSDPLAGLAAPERVPAFEGAYWLALRAPGKAIEPLERARAALATDPGSQLYLAALVDLARAHGEHGDLDAAAAALTEALDLLEPHPHDAIRTGRPRRVLTGLLAAAPGHRGLLAVRDRLFDLGA